MFVWYFLLSHKISVPFRVPFIKEPSGVATVGLDGKRPNGITLVFWRGERCLIWYVTVVYTLAVIYSDSRPKRGVNRWMSSSKKGVQVHRFVWYTSLLSLSNSPWDQSVRRSCPSSNSATASQLPQENHVSTPFFMAHVHGYPAVQCNIYMSDIYSTDS